ncbi:MAG: hypothetical protein V1493_02510, partial [Candidatus Diapherotrites archaeon]
MKRYVLPLILLFSVVFLLGCTQPQAKQCKEGFKLLPLNGGVSFCYPESFGEPKITEINPSKAKEMSETMGQEVKVTGKSASVSFENLIYFRAYI